MVQPGVMSWREAAAYSVQQSIVELELGKMIRMPARTAARYMPPGPLLLIQAQSVQHTHNNTFSRQVERSL